MGLRKQVAQTGSANEQQYGTLLTVLFAVYLRFIGGANDGLLSIEDRR